MSGVATKQINLSIRPRAILLSIATLLATMLLTAYAQTTPTATPSPLAPSQGVHTPEDFQNQYDRWPDDYKFTFDDEVSVRFAYPSPIIDGAGFAFISHIPSTSTVVLRRPRSFIDAQGNESSTETGEDLWGKDIVIRKDYRSEEGAARLESVLVGEMLVRRILSKSGEELGNHATQASPATSSKDGSIAAFDVGTNNSGSETAPIEPTAVPTSTPRPTSTPLC
ncbi:MAG: hypothetical protein HQ475_11945 [SAR202 cluster bacterium]|nr:hypothetical protein [SAR202 cluster bacterium]